MREVGTGLLRGEGKCAGNCCGINEIRADLVFRGADGLGSKWKDLPRAALESLSLEAYRSHALTAAQLRRLLGFETRTQMDDFLKEHEVYDFTAEDFKQDCEALRQVRARELSIELAQRPRLLSFPDSASKWQRSCMGQIAERIAITISRFLVVIGSISRRGYQRRSRIPVEHLVNVVQSQHTHGGAGLYSGGADVRQQESVLECEISRMKLRLSFKDV
jgi:hypothetical protein